MNIGFDIDGVLYPWQKATEVYLKAFKGIAETYSEVWKNPDAFMSKAFQKNLCSMEDICTRILPEKDIIDMLWELTNKGHTIYYITSRPEEVRTATEMYFQKHGFPQNENLIFTRDKAFYVKLLEIDTFIEDRWEYAEELKNITKVILVRQSWNENFWNEFLTVGHVCEIPKVLEAELV
jgi:uncharacterized HAD superfamily protein